IPDPRLGPPGPVPCPRDVRRPARRRGRAHAPIAHAGAARGGADRARSSGILPRGPGSLPGPRIVTPGAGPPLGKRVSSMADIIQAIYSPLILIYGLSHIVRPRPWADFFIAMRHTGFAPLIIGTYTLPTGLILIVEYLRSLQSGASTFRFANWTAEVEDLQQ